jgi:hypothetical protein
LAARRADYYHTLVDGIIPPSGWAGFRFLLVFEIITGVF